IMDNSSNLDKLFFQSGRISPRGEEFVKLVDDFREGVIAIIGDDYHAIAQKVKTDFSTEAIKREGASIEWLKYHYEGFPLIASITKMTQIQSDVKSVQGEILSAMFSGQLQSEV